jgi:hypothetical protein
MAKFKVLVNASIPKAGVALCKGKILDTDTYKALTDEMVEKAVKDEWLEPIEKKGKRDERQGS